MRTTDAKQAAESYLLDRPILSRRQRLAIWLFLPLLLSLLFAIPTVTGRLDAVERLTIDWRFHRRGPLPPDPRIVIVEISETGRRSLTRDDLHFDLREHLGAVITRLADAGAVAIGCDFWLQGGGDPGVDAQLAKVLAEANVVLGVAVANNVSMRSPQVFLDQRPDEGCLAVQPDPDGVLRRIPLTPNLDLLDREGQSATRVPHMPFVLSYLLLSEEAAQAKREPPVVDLSATGQARLGDRIVRYGELINFAAGPGDGFHTLEFADIVRGQCDLAAVNGAVVLIGTNRSVEDRFAMPIAPRMIPGVYYHANVVDMILQNRPLVRWPASRAGLGWLVALMTCAAGWYFFHLRQWWLTRAGWLLLLLYFALGGGAFILGWRVLCLQAFSQRVVLPMAPPLFAMVAIMLAGLTAQLALSIAHARRLAQRNRQIESLFGRSVSSQVLAAILADPGRVARTEVREVSVLFCDIRGFTATSTEMSPEGVAAMLNEYFEAITSAVFDHDGFVDKFVGDELMAVFSAPLEQEDHAGRAAGTALAIKHQLAALNSRRAARGQKPLNCGVGIHCGPAAAGHIGTARRANYTVVGDTVNLAARIQEMTSGGEILLSQAVVDRLDGRFAVRSWRTVELRGSTGGHALYQLEVPDE